MQAPETTSNWPAKLAVLLCARGGAAKNIRCSLTYMYSNFVMRSVKVQTPAAFDFWCYIIITWHPDTGLQFYGNSNLKTSLHAPQSNPAPPPVYSGKLNFVVGRGLNQKPEQMCGLVYMSSIAVFKQNLNQEWVNKIFAFFWKNSKCNLRAFLVGLLVSICTSFKSALHVNDIL